MAQLEHIEAIERRLWSAADTLRANSGLASNEYFLPVMAFEHSFPMRGLWIGSTPSSRRFVGQTQHLTDASKLFARDLLLARFTNGEVTA